MTTHACNMTDIRRFCEYAQNQQISFFHPKVSGGHDHDWCCWGVNKLKDFKKGFFPTFVIKSPPQKEESSVERIADLKSFRKKNFCGCVTKWSSLGGCKCKWTTVSLEPKSCYHTNNCVCSSGSVWTKLWPVPCFTMIIMVVNYASVWGIT